MISHRTSRSLSGTCALHTDVRKIYINCFSADFILPDRTRFRARSPEFKIYYAAVDKQSGSIAAIGEALRVFWRKLLKRQDSRRIVSSFARLAERSTRGFRNSWPKDLLAAKTYANEPLKPAVTVGFCTFENRNPILLKTLRRCME